MKSKEKLIIKLIFIILVIIIAIILAININKEQKQPASVEANEQEERVEESKDYLYSKYITIIDNENIYFNLNDIVNNYLNHISSKDKQSTYKLLDSDYIKERKITEENVWNNVESINNFNEFIIEQIYEKSIYDDIGYTAKYNILGRMWSNNYNSKDYIYIIVNVDYTNMTYAIEPCIDVNLQETSYDEIIEYLEEETRKEVESIYKNSENFDINGENIDYESDEPSKYSNVFEETQFSEEELLKRYFNYFMINFLYDTENSYEMLSDECKENDFKNINEFFTYINDNKENLKNDNMMTFNLRNEDTIFNQEKDQYEVEKEYTITTNNGYNYIMYIKDGRMKSLKVKIVK